jgi:pantoate--beta-alanine ligase
LKLFQLVQPHAAVFGEKDYQQLAIIRRMVADLDVDVRIVPGPIVREADGLAMSSRNVYLSADERRQALALSRSLGLAEEWARQDHDAASLRARIRAEIERSPLADIDYVEVVGADDLAPFHAAIDRSALVALAVRFGRTRLIDNRVLPR